MRHYSGKALLALTLLFSFHPFAVAQTGATSAAKAGITGSDKGDGGSKEKNRLAKQIDAIRAHPPLDRAHWGIDVVDRASGKTIFSLNPEQLFLPASNTKLFTTVAALDRKSTRLNSSHIPLSR